MGGGSSVPYITYHRADGVKLDLEKPLGFAEHHKNRYSISRHLADIRIYWMAWLHDRPGGGHNCTIACDAFAASCFLMPARTG